MKCVESSFLFNFGHVFFFITFQIKDGNVLHLKSNNTLNEWLIIEVDFHPLWTHFSFPLLILYLLLVVELDRRKKKIFKPFINFKHMSQRQLVSWGEVSKTMKRSKDKPFFDIKNKKDFVYEIFIYFMWLFYSIGVKSSLYVFLWLLVSKFCNCFLLLCYLFNTFV